MKLQYNIVVTVVIHISKSKGVAEMANKTNKIKKKGGSLRLQVLRFIYKTMNKKPFKSYVWGNGVSPNGHKRGFEFLVWSQKRQGKIEDFVHK